MKKTINIHIGDQIYFEIENRTQVCPYCKTSILPRYIHAIEHIPVEGKRIDALQIFTQCTVHKCYRAYCSIFTKSKYGYYEFAGISKNPTLEKKTFASIIDEISPTFITIYNQAYAAEQIELSDICGVGYRKAFEFLIKDYIISISDASIHESIKLKSLAKCINEHIENYNLKHISTRATWLGNDETHYIRKWENKHISDLKKTISVAVNWIIHEVETKQILEDMSE